MVVEEGQPTLRFVLITVPPQTFKISGNCRLGNVESQVEQFAVDSRSAPGWILRLHAPDQLADLGTDYRSSRSPTPGPNPPKEPEPSAMPGHHGLRLHDDQRFDPARPDAAEHNPEQPVETLQTGTGLLPLENAELLAQGNGFQGEFVAWQAEGANVRHHSERKRNHHFDLS